MSFAIGSHFLSLAEWLSKVKAVISLFLPYVQEIKTTNTSSVKFYQTVKRCSGDSGQT